MPTLAGIAAIAIFLSKPGQRRWRTQTFGTAPEGPSSSERARWLDGPQGIVLCGGNVSVLDCGALDQWHKTGRARHGARQRGGRERSRIIDLADLTRDSPVALADQFGRCHPDSVEASSFSSWAGVVLWWLEGGRER